MAVTLADLRTRARERSDMEDSTFITDTEFNSYIDASWKELYDILVSAYEDYFTAESSELTISSGNEITLPTDFYKLRGVDRKLGTDDFFELSKFDFTKRNKKTDGIHYPWNGELRRQYRIVGGTIQITPKNHASGTYRLWYIPQPTDLTTDTDELPQLAIGSGWEEYIVLGAAIKAKDKEESETLVLQQEKEQMRIRLYQMSKDRDAGSPDTITDVRDYDDTIFRY